jgi:assimilatory nitrate reductase catalytic subunit
MAEGDLVRVRSRRGQVVIPVAAAPGQTPGQVYIAMHWGSEFLGGRDPQGQPMHGVNALTQPLFCPTSKQPELKHAAVAIEPLNLPWQLVAMAWLPASQALSVREALAQMGRDFAFFSAVPFGREPDAQARVGVLLQLADAQAPTNEQLNQLEDWLGINGADVMRHDDPGQHQRRAMRVVQDESGQHVAAFVMAGDVRAATWVKPLLQEDQLVEALGTMLLYPGKQAPGNVVSRGKQVCTCFNVTEPQILAYLPNCNGTDEQRLAQLQGELRCGTNCGSCVPALRKLVKTIPIATAEMH